jgi:hypothetical protein
MKPSTLIKSLVALNRKYAATNPDPQLAKEVRWAIQTAADHILSISTMTAAARARKAEMVLIDPAADDAARSAALRDYGSFELLSRITGCSQRTAQGWLYGRAIPAKALNKLRAHIAKSIAER